jgi:hypothetical protein
MLSSTETGNFLMATGLLFEINRVSLHPYGYTLVVDQDGYPKILDSSENPEHLIFEERLFNKGLSKFKQFIRDRGKQAMLQRKKILGFVVQGGAIGQRKNP